MSDFHYYPKSFDIPKLAELREAWKSIPFNRLRRAIAIEHQYLHFHMFMVENTRHTGKDGNPSDSTWHLSLTVRAGAIKAALLISASIIEAGLLAHALKRKYKNLPNDSKKRTFGSIIFAWKEDSKEGEFFQNLETIEALCNIRNHIHLEKIANTETIEKFYERLLEKEKLMLEKSLQLITWVQSLKS